MSEKCARCNNRAHRNDTWVERNHDDGSCLCSVCAYTTMRERVIELRQQLAVANKEIQMLRKADEQEDYP